MSDRVERIVELLAQLSSSDQIEVLEAVASRLGVDGQIGKNNEERIRLAKECLLLEEEAWQHGAALAEITGLCEGHYAKFRIRGFMRPEE